MAWTVLRWLAPLAVLAASMVGRGWAQVQKVVPVSLLAAGALYGDASCDFSADVLIAGQTFRVIMDSGSSFFAVASTSCTPASGCTDVSPRYPSAGSGSFTANYGSGSISGGLTQNVATIDGLGTSMSFGAITAATGTFFSTSCTGMAATQGIVGLAYSSLAIAGTEPFMDVIAGLGTPDGFALQLCGLKAGQWKTGNYWIGGYDTNFTSSPMRYINIVKKQYYNVQAYSFNINGDTVAGTTSLSSETSIVDSGTTIISLINQDVFDALMYAIPNGGFVTFRAGTNPDDILGFWQGTTGLLGVTINSGVALQVSFLGNEGSPVDIAVPTENFIIQDTNGLWYFVGFGYNVDATKGSVNIFGATMLKNQVVFFDRGSNARIGFAPGINCYTKNATTAGINYFAGASQLAPSTIAAVALALFVVALSLA